MSLLREAFDTTVPPPSLPFEGRKPQTVNEILHDVILRHRHRTLMLENGIIQRITPMLIGVRKDIEQRFQQSLSLIQNVQRLAPEQLYRRQAAVEELQLRLASFSLQVEDLLRITSTRIEGILTQDLVGIVQAEERLMANLLQRNTPAVVGIKFDALPLEEVIELVQEPLGGKTFAERLQTNYGETVEVMRQQLGQGILLGESMPKLTERIRQTVNGITRHRAEQIARTEVQRVANATAERIYQQNSDVIKAAMWISTLDRATCLICARLDRKVFPLAKISRRPPAHTSCRCFLSPITKSWRELGLDLDELPEGTRASLSDKFTGQVPATLSYPDWFAQQDETFQREVLGKTRFRLYQSGALKLEQMATDKMLTLNQLRQRGVVVTPLSERVANVSRTTATTLAQQENRLQEVLDFNSEREFPGQTKRAIASKLANRLQQNPAFAKLAKFLADERFIASADDLQEATSALVSQWAITSGDKDPLSIALQLAAKDHFQLKNVAIWWDDAAQKIAQAKWGVYQPGLKAFLQAQYEETQAWFKTQKIREVPIYRGVRWSETAMPQAMKDQFQESVPTRLKVQSQPLASFTVDSTTASAFAQGEMSGLGGRNPYRLVVGGKMPVDRILSTAQTGFGAKGEGEIVVLGNTESLWSVGWKDQTPTFYHKKDGLLGQMAEASGVTPAQPTPPPKTGGRPALFDLLGL